jgi:hypothetical protein
MNTPSAYAGLGAVLVNGQHAGKRPFIPMILMSLLVDLTLPFKFKQKQFLICLSFAMTINKGIPYLSLVSTFQSRLFLMDSYTLLCLGVFLIRLLGCRKDE